MKIIKLTGTIFSSNKPGAEIRSDAIDRLKKTIEAKIKKGSASGVNPIHQMVVDALIKKMSEKPKIYNTCQFKAWLTNLCEELEEFKSFKETVKRAVTTEGNMSGIARMIGPVRFLEDSQSTKHKQAFGESDTDEFLVDLNLFEQKTTKAPTEPTSMPLPQVKSKEDAIKYLKDKPSFSMVIVDDNGTKKLAIQYKDKTEYFAIEIMDGAWHVLPADIGQGFVKLDKFILKTQEVEKKIEVENKIQALRDAKPGSYLIVREQDAIYVKGVDGLVKRHDNFNQLYLSGLFDPSKETFLIVERSNTSPAVAPSIYDEPQDSLGHSPNNVDLLTAISALRHSERQPTSVAKVRGKNFSDLEPQHKIALQVSARYVDRYLKTPPDLTEPQELAQDIESISHGLEIKLRMKELNDIENIQLNNGSVKKYETGRVDTILKPAIDRVKAKITQLMTPSAELSLKDVMQRITELTLLETSRTKLEGSDVFLLPPADEIQALISKLKHQKSELMIKQNAQQSHQLEEKIKEKLSSPDLLSPKALSLKDQSTQYHTLCSLKQQQLITKGINPEVVIILDDKIKETASSMSKKLTELSSKALSAYEKREDKTQRDTAATAISGIIKEIKTLGKFVTIEGLPETRVLEREVGKLIGVKSTKVQIQAAREAATIDNGYLGKMLQDCRSTGNYNLALRDE
jgi:hypothetical protein